MYMLSITMVTLEPSIIFDSKNLSFKNNCIILCNKCTDFEEE